MKEKIKKIIFGYLPGFITGIIICGAVSVIAATYSPSKDVTYDNKVSGLSSTDVQGAIDELYGVCTAKPPGEQIIEDGGLEKDPYECRYFFTGANPNNYVTFNGETAGWRIISVGCDGTIKIMRTADINTSNTLIWDTYGSNNWARPATLNTYLNETYLNSLSSEAQGQIVASDFSIGSVEYYNDDLEDQINDENSTTWNGKIALPTVSEYIRTNSNSNCKTFSNFSSNYSTCKNTTWMFNSDIWWTLSSRSGNSYEVVRVSNFGDIDLFNASSASHGVRPTVILSSEVKITGGNGSKNNPYKLS